METDFDAFKINLFRTHQDENPSTVLITLCTKTRLPDNVIDALSGRLQT